MSKDKYPERGCEVAVIVGTWDSELQLVLCKYIALVKSAGQGGGFSFRCHYKALCFQAPALSSWVHLSGPRLQGLLRVANILWVCWISKSLNRAAVSK